MFAKNLYHIQQIIKYDGSQSSITTLSANLKPGLQKVDEIKNVTGRLSDFASCISSNNEEINDDKDDGNVGFQTVLDKNV